VLFIRGIKKLYRQIKSDEKGIALLEFALVAPIFFMLILGIIEISIMTFVSAAFDDAGRSASRLIRIGEVQQSANAETTFRTALCTGLPAIINCNDISIDVRTFDDFATVTTGIQLDNEGNPINTAFTPGGSSTVNIVRLSYRWEFFTPLIGNLLSDNNTNSVLLSSLTVQLTEPYGS